MATRPLTRPVTEQELSSYSGTRDEVNNLPPVPPAQFQFFAAFDGTWNDRTNLDLAGTKQPTNVAQIEKLVEKNDSFGVASKYYAGIGTSGTASQYIGGSIGPQYEAVAKAEAAYQDLIQQTDKWQAANSGQPLDLSVSMAAFSRGATSALLFSRILNERGVPDLSSGYEVTVVETRGEETITRTETRYSRNLIEPGDVPVASMLLYDPVAAGVMANMRLSDNVRDVAVFVAGDEHRSAFAAMQLTDPNDPDPRVHVYKNAGAHTDQGGGYDNGLGALNLELGHLYLERNGLAAAPIPAELAFDPESAVVHNSSVGLFAGDWVETRPVRVEWSTGPVQQPTPGAPLAQTEISPLGGGIYLKSTIDDQGRTSALVVDEQGKVLLQAKEGDLLTRDPETGYIKVTNAAGEVLNDYTPAPAIIPDPADPADPADPTDPGSAGAVNGHDHQSDNHLNLIDLPTPELASLFAGGSASGAYGAGQLGGFDVLPFNKGSSFLVNADGDIAGEINRLPNGDLQIKNLYGEAVYVNQAGTVLSDDDYRQAQQDHQQAQQDAQGNAQTSAQWSQAAGAIGLMNSIIGLQHWDSMSDLQRLAAVTSIYNTLDVMSGGQALPGNLGAAAGALGLLSALDQGNVGGAVYSGLSLVENLTSTAGVLNSGWVSLNMPGAGNFLPGLGLVLALDSGDPVSILAAAANFIPVYGQIISICITLLGGLFSDDEEPERPNLPTQKGQAQAVWDENGQLHVSTTQNVEGAGPTAAAWLDHIVGGLQSQLAGQSDAEGNPRYGLIPQRLPSLGFAFDPDGMNYFGAPGHLYLKWFDAAGTEQTRYYDGQGNRADGTGETLSGDFMAHAQDAIVPAWQAQTVLAHWQQTVASEGLEAANAQARQTEGNGLPQELADGLHQSLHALTLAPVGAPAQANPAPAALVDIDGDGFLEQTQWLAAGQQVLAIDANGDGAIGAGELLSLGGGAALNSLGWLDANRDQVINASDPAFGALRLWMDINSDGQSSAETQTLSQTGITAIDFGSNPPAVIYSDGSRTALSARTLTGDILGVQYHGVTGGVLQLDEQAGAAPVATLHAVNTRQFDGQAVHQHGGDVDTDGVDGADGATVTVAAGNSRLATASANTFTTGAGRSTQTSTNLGAGDARLQTAATGQAISGQPVLAAQANGATVRSSTTMGVVFVPGGAASAAAEIRQATEAMVRSANPGLFEPGSGMLGAVALGAAAVQWPTLVSADTAPLTQTGAASLTPQMDANAINWQALEGSRVSVAAADGLLAGGASGAGSTNAGTPLLAGAALGDYAAGPDASNLPSDHTEWMQAAMDSVASEVPLPLASPALDPLAPEAAAASWAGSPMASDPLIDYPQVQGEQSAAVEDTVQRFSEAWLLANDSTVNAPAWPGEPSLRITSVFAPAHGSVSLQTGANGGTEVVFLPDANYHGPASFSYTVTDQYGLSSTASVGLNVAAVNDAPVTTGETTGGDEDHTLQFSAASLLANDFDADTAVDGDALRITRVGMAQHGQVFLAADGTVSFIPDINYNGPAQFTYWVGDRDPAQIAANGAGEGYETPATVNLTVLAVNDLPVVLGEVMESDEDIVLDINPTLLLANDSDVDTATSNAEPAQVLAITAVSNAQHGSIVLLADGTLRFTPEANYFGAAGFSYTVDDGNGGQVVGQVVVNLAPVNDAPDVAGETIAFNEDEIQTITQASLLANDSDVDNPHSALRIVAVDNATHGAVALNPDGSIRFAPAADYFGPAQFTYTVSDGVGGFTVGTASLDIAPVNDAPRLLGESATLDEDTEARFSIPALLANDHDVDNPHTDLSITAVAMDPASSAAGMVQIVAGEIVFTPTLNFNGAASFTYTVADGVGGSSKATVNLNFTPVNDAPVANSELIWGKRGVSYTLSQAALLANDTDAESAGNLQISAISNVQNGTAVLNADGSVSFTPEAGHDGRGSFDYLVRDPDGATSSATAQIDFSRININPLATDDSFTGYEDVAFSITQAQLLVNDSDADNPAADLRVSAVADAQNGTVSLEADGTVRFVPTANFHGTASFSYQVSDGEGGSAWASARLDVQSVNDAPVIEAIWYGDPVYDYYKWVATPGYYVYPEYGPPTYVDPGPHLEQLTSPAEVQGFLNSYGYLMGPVGNVASYSLYSNGQVRPTSFSALDGTAQAYVPPVIDPDGGVGVPGYYTTVPANAILREHGQIIAYDPDGDSSAFTLTVAEGPQHGHLWVNAVTPNTEGDVAHVSAVLVDKPGAWQYYSHVGDPYYGNEAFTLRVTDAGGASTDVGMQALHYGTSLDGGGGGGGGGKKPVTLDLNGNGLEYIGLDDSQAYFDVNNDGWRERLAWVSAGDALLVRDIGADRVIDRFDEISFTGYLPGAKTDLEGLRAFDSNGDGLLSRLDARWQEFSVWQDADGNGASQAAELRTLDEIGIVQIGLSSDQQLRQIDGVTEFGQSRFTWADGRTGAVGDVALPVDASARLPATAEVATSGGAPAPEFPLEMVQAQTTLTEPVPPAAPQPFLPTPEHAALLMVQVVNAFTGACETAALAAIETQGGSSLQQSLLDAQAQWEQSAQSQALQFHGATS